MRLPLFALLAGCSTELPPADAPSDRGGISVAEVQEPGASECADPGAPVSLEGVVVTAVDAFDESGTGDVGTIYVEDPAGGPFSGIAVFAPTGETDLRVGDIVDVDGEVTEFQLGCIDPAWEDDSGGTVTQLVSARVTWTGEWRAPEPAVVALTDFADPAEAEPWEGVLVRIEGAEAQGPPDEGRVDLTVDLLLDDDLYRVPDVTTGTTFTSVTGVVSYIYQWTLLPRSAEDVEP